MSESVEPTIKEPEVTQTETSKGQVDKKAIIPEGLSKNQWKKLQKRKRWEESKEEYREVKRVKRKAAKQRRKELLKTVLEDDPIYHQMKKKQVPSKQLPSNINIIMDCEFDSLMNHKEIVSMSNQISRLYSAKRHCDYDVGLVILSFNKNLKRRFDESVSQYHNWTNLKFLENETLEEILPKDEEERSKYVYLTADTDEVVDTLEEGHTYIIGGIVDKNRHKKLCYNKAKELGLKVGRLPIDEFIKINGRQVLATSHVYELCCKWFEEGKDWKKAFDHVLPPRKLKQESDEGKNDEVIVEDASDVDVQNLEEVSEVDEKHEKNASKDDEEALVKKTEHAKEKESE